ncbi:MAG: glycoside hydrolase family 15 protein [Dehalococcoidia bacterium]|nr:glycoside hydrolase family 15 protein [Dehalococcoidia bacterium]
MTSYRPIDDYAVIGDCRSAALVSSEGSIDWLCFPRFDSRSVFGALLDVQRGGFFRVRPAGPYEVQRRYLPETNVLETIFRCQSGGFVLRDLMPVATEAEKRLELTPAHELLREIEVTEGQVDIEIDYLPRPDYGRAAGVLEDRGLLGIWLDTQQGMFILMSDLKMEVDAERTGASGRVRLTAGERRYASFSFSEDAPAVIPALGAIAREKVARSISWWHAWSGRCSYVGPYRYAVLRSALTLKLMAYAPSGAVVAAPTTSLPERIGGVRNWDYRYCWLRDASLTLRALFRLDYRDEAQAFLAWMLHTTRLTAPELQVVYDVYGEAKLPEKELPHLEGYQGSRPVRVGNGAHGQLQLDVYGEVIDAVARFADMDGRIDKDTAKFLNGLGHAVCKRWQEPDEGIWEVRAGPAQHTHSKVLCWVALDRLIRLHERGHIKVSVDEFRKERQAIRDAIEEHGYNTSIESYTRLFDGEEVDASLLTLPLYGYIDGMDPKMRSTYARICEQLTEGDLIYRYRHSTDDGLPPGEGAFGICSFWAVECLARGGEVDAARTSFERLLTYANDLGLFGEQIEPREGGALGNFPQAFTHIGLISAALTLAEITGEAVAAPTAAATDLKLETGS